jgi:hypothetical protein
MQITTVGLDFDPEPAAPRGRGPRERTCWSSLLVMAPPSQGLEPPINPARFNSRRSTLATEVSLWPNLVMPSLFAGRTRLGQTTLRNPIGAR